MGVKFVKLVEEFLAPAIKEDWEKAMGDLSDEKIAYCLKLFAKDPRILDLLRHVYVRGWLDASQRHLLMDALQAMEVDKDTH